jgi:hypothetical protein
MAKNPVKCYWILPLTCQDDEDLFSFVIIEFFDKKRILGIHLLVVSLCDHGGSLDFL